MCIKKVNLKAFTLVEVLLVVVIIAIIVSVTTPRFRNSLTTIELSNLVRNMAQTMRYCRKSAVIEGNNYQMKLDVQGRKYYVKKMISQPKERNYMSGNIPEGVNIAATKDIVNFYSDGSMDDITIYIFKGEKQFSNDLQKAVNKDFDLGQVQIVAHTEYIYTIKTQPSIGRIKVIAPK